MFHEILHWLLISPAEPPADDPGLAGVSLVTQLGDQAQAVPMALLGAIREELEG